MKNLLVVKFGGTSLMTTDRIKAAAEIVASEIATGKNLMVVVSAMGHTTDALIDLARDITAMPNAREMDALMATGEQVSATLMSIALHSLNIKSRSFSGGQARIVTSNEFGNANIEQLNIRALQASVENGYVPVITGFQGVTNEGDVTTLGRGGSDTTAIAIAAAMKAERCDIYTDVDGIYSADPRIVPDAIKLDSIAITEMLELARNGAKVLNAKSVEIARDKRVALRVRSTFNRSDTGTLISHEPVPNKRGYTGVSINREIDCIEFNLGKLEIGPDRTLKTLKRARSKTKIALLNHLSTAGIQAEIIAAARLNPFKILVKVAKVDAVTAVATLHKSEVSSREITVNGEVVCLAVVADRITIKHEVEALSALTRQAIPVLAFSVAPKVLNLIVPVNFAEDGARVLHQHLEDCHGDVGIDIRQQSLRTNISNISSSPGFHGEAIRM